MKKLNIPEKNIISFSDSNLYYSIDHRREYCNLVDHNKIIPVPAGIKGDNYIIAFCLRNPDSLIISNDLFVNIINTFPKIG